jgi:hypothetical protein
MKRGISSQGIAKMYSLPAHRPDLSPTKHVRAALSGLEPELSNGSHPLISGNSKNNTPHFNGRLRTAWWGVEQDWIDSMPRRLAASLYRTIQM